MTASTYVHGIMQCLHVRTTSFCSLSRSLLLTAASHGKRCKCPFQWLEHWREEKASNSLSHHACTKGACCGDHWVIPRCCHHHSHVLPTLCWEDSSETSPPWKLFFIIRWYEIEIWWLLSLRKTQVQLRVLRKENKVKGERWSKVSSLQEVRATGPARNMGEMKRWNLFSSLYFVPLSPSTFLTWITCKRTRINNPFEMLKASHHESWSLKRASQRLQPEHHSHDSLGGINSMFCALLYHR